MSRFPSPLPFAGFSGAGVIVVCILTLLTVSACRFEPPFERLEHRVDFGDGDVVVEHLGEQWRGEQRHTVDPGSAEKDVFVIVSNPMSGEREAARVHVPERARTEVAGSGTSDSDRGSSRQSMKTTAGTMAGLPQLSATGDKTAVSRTSYEEGATTTFHGLTDGSRTRNEFEAKLLERRVESDSAGVNVWVARDLMGNGDPYPEAAEAIADAFFEDKDGNPGIFELNTSLFGDFWGPNDRSAVIGNTDTVDVVLLDIAGAGAPGSSGTTILGYFDPRDLYRRSIIGTSAERAMVYVHGPAFTERDGVGGWSITDRWPAEMLLTVAHEFQHLINFYEKRVRRGVPVDTWLDELMSLQAEEIAGSLLQHHEVFGSNGSTDTDGIIHSPRGLPAACARADTNGNSSCEIDKTFARTGDYNSGDNHARSVTAWADEEVRYRSSDLANSADYAASYLFGAWLLRNFGLHGELFRALNNNVSGGRDAVTGAVRKSARAQGLERSDYSFGQLLNLWKSALVLSDLSVDGHNVPVPYRMSRAPAGDDSTDAFFKLTPDGWLAGSWSEPLRLGSVDIQAYGTPNYGRLDSEGRWKSPENKMEPTSAQVLRIPSVTSKITIDYSVPPGASVTVITRPPVKPE